MSKCGSLAKAALVAFGGLGLLAPAGEAGAQQTAAPSNWYRQVIQVMDGDGPLDTGDGRPSRDGRLPDKERHGHAAPIFYDWNGDGLRDLIVGGFSGRFRLYVNHGSQGAPSFNGYDWIAADGGDALLSNFCCTATGIRIADIDGDGIDDLTAGSYLPGFIFWFPGQAKGLGSRGTLTDGSGLPIMPRLDEAASHPNNHFAAKPAWMDWNGDGRLDLVIGDAKGDLVARRNWGPATIEGITAFARQPVFDRHSGMRGYDQLNVFDVVDGGGGPLAGEEYLSPAAADWNGDGLIDLIVGTQSGAVYLLLNKGGDEGPSFAAPQQLLPAAPGGEYSPLQLLRGDEKVARGALARASIDVADWNGDGKPDLILGGWSRDLRVRSHPAAAEKRGLDRALAKLIALDKKAGLNGEEPLRDRLRTTVYYENPDLAAQLAALEKELVAYLQPARDPNSGRLSDYVREHGYVRVYLRR